MVWEGSDGVVFDEKSTTYIHLPHDFLALQSPFSLCLYFSRFVDESNQIALGLVLAKA